MFMRYGVSILALGLVLAGPTSGLAQPTGWVTAQPFFTTINLVRALNLATGAVEFSLELPAGITVGEGMLTHDGQFYLLATSVGIARFNAASKVFEGFFGPPRHATGVQVSPSGRWVYASGPSGLTKLDATTGQIVRHECCDTVPLAFTPDGATRVELRRRETAGVLETVVSAFADEGDEPPTWQIVVPGVVLGRPAIDNARLAVRFAGADNTTILFNLDNGTESGRVRAGDLALRGDTLLVSSYWPGATPFDGEFRLTAYALPSLAESHVKTVPSFDPSRVSQGAVHISSDGGVIYWLSFTAFGLSVSHTGYLTLDAETYETVGNGVLGPQRIRSLSIEARPACVFDAPLSTIPTSAEGGIVDVPVVPRPACGPWTVPPDRHILNPGPHNGPATIRVAIMPNTDSGIRNNTVHVGGRTVSIPQAAAVPSAPEMTARVAGSRVTVSWIPAPGAGVRQFVVRGAVRGGVLIPVATLSATGRTWTSPSLPAGSYVVDLVARNDAGDSAPSTRFEFSIGSSATPDAPVGLAADVRDDVVTLTWEPSPSGPAPSAYIVEAAPAGTSAFAEVARTEMPTFAATRVPAGTWEARVRAVTAGGSSVPSTTVSIAAVTCTTAPSVPLGLWTMTSVGLSTRLVTLQWSAPSTGSVESYIVEAGSSPGNADLGSFVVPFPRSFFEVPLPPGIRAFVRVLGQNACGTGAATADVALVDFSGPS
jgi:hypothetical protein